MTRLPVGTADYPPVVCRCRVSRRSSDRRIAGCWLWRPRL